MKYSIIFLSISVCCIVAQQFVVKEPPKKTSPHKLKEQVITQMGSVLELESMILETSSKIQQKLCKEIRASLEGLSASRARLEKLKKLLEEEFHRLELHKKAQDQFLSALG